MAQPIRDTLWPVADNIVYKQMVVGNVIYMNGLFQNIGGVPRATFAAIDRFSGSVLPLTLPTTGIYDYILEFTIINGVIYYTTSAGPSVIQTYDLATGIPVPGWVSPVIGFGGSALIYDMDTDGTHLFVIGDFTNVNGSSHQGFISIDPVTAAVAAWDAQITPALPRSISIFGGVVYIAGSFSTAGGSSRQWFAAFDANTGALMPWSVSGLGGTGAQSILATASAVYIGGNWSVVWGQPRALIAAVDPVTGALLAPFDANLTGGYVVESICQGPDGTVFAGGNFLTSHGLDRLGFVQLDGVTGIPTDVRVDFQVDYFNHVFMVNYFDNAVFMSDGVGFGSPPRPTYYYRYLFPPIPDPPIGTPQPPRIRFLNRRLQNGRPELTMLRWDPVTRDMYNNPITVDKYLVFRTASKNLEDPTLIAEITSLDLRGFVDTLFVEEIDGYYRYCVAAVAGSHEGGKSCINIVSMEQSERLE